MMPSVGNSAAASYLPVIPGLMTLLLSRETGVPWVLSPGHVGTMDLWEEETDFLTPDHGPTIYFAPFPQIIKLTLHCEMVLRTNQKHICG